MIMTHQIFIDGAAGTTGLEIAERLSGRAGLNLITLDDSERKNESKRREALNAADLVVLCLPDDAAIEAVSMIDNDSTRVIDASSAHRIAPDWTYGFPELNAGQRDTVRNARFVSNPGCYPTGFLALVAPLVAAGLLPQDGRYSLNAVSGYSGGGKGLIQRFDNERDIAFRSYGLGLGHKHIPEMQTHAGLDYAPLFAPAVVPAFRGMLIEVPIMGEGLDANAMRAALTDRFATEKLVHIYEGEAPDELLLRDGIEPSDTITLHVFGDKNGEQVRLIATLDNLGKGASGACVQNLNLMLGLPEYEGLRL